MAALKQYVETHKLKGKTFVAITCGANMNFDRLRFVAERAEFGEQREALFAVTIPEERGSFKRFCELIGPRSVTEFNYRISDAKVAHVFVGLAIARRDEAERIARNFVRHGFATVNLTDDELAKEHVRHMVGGRSRTGARRAAVPLRLPRAARRADALPVVDAPGLEHQPVPLPQPGRGLRPHPGRHPGAARPTSARFADVPATTLAYPCVDEIGNPVYRLFLR